MPCTYRLPHRNQHNGIDTRLFSCRVDVNYGTTGDLPCRRNNLAGRILQLGNYLPAAWRRRRNTGVVHFKVRGLHMYFCHYFFPLSLSGKDRGRADQLCPLSFCQATPEISQFPAMPQCRFAAASYHDPFLTRSFQAPFPNRQDRCLLCQGL